MSSYRAIIGLGSNQGDRAANLLHAISALINNQITLCGCSSLYETDPVGFLDQPQFLNMVILVGGHQLPPPHRLLADCLMIEERLGRQRTIKDGPRTIDLDLLVYDDLIFDEGEEQPPLTLPHPRMHLRQFVLAPICDLIPYHLHPKFHISYRQLLDNLPAKEGVRCYQG